MTNKIFPTLYEKSGNKIKHWTIEVREEQVGAVIVTSYGSGDSKVRSTTKLIREGKNIGRSNETSAYEQAESEALSTWNKKLDKGYVENLADLDNEVLLPMLAHNFHKRGYDIKYPCYVQPKLDGVRCLAKKTDDNTIKYYSRMGKEFTTLEHLTEDLLCIMKTGDVLDGEIYSHDITFQEMIRLVKKLRPESKTLEYHVFDLVDTQASFDERIGKLSVTVMVTSLVKYVETKKINDGKSVKEMHDKYLADGYEGLMLRNIEGKYALNKRSSDLQKYKVFQDEEYEIVGGKPSTGTEEGCVIFDVKLEDGRTFSVRPRGSFELRKEWMDNIDKLIGKKLTVRFQEKSEKGVPRFPVGISIRDYEG